MGIDINKAKDKIFGATQQTEVSDIQMPVSQSTPNPIDIDKASQKVTFGGQWQEEQKKLEQNMKPILDGLPDKGRILQDRSTGKLHFVSDSYSTSNQDEIKSIIDEGMKGEVVNAGDEAVSRINKDILSTMPEAGLLSQQVIRGGMGGGSYGDEILTSDPAEQWKYEKTRKAYEDEYPERAYPAQIAGLGATTYLTGGLATGVGAAKKVKDGVNVVKNWYSKLAPLAQKATQIGGTTALAGGEGLLYGSGDGNTLDERTINALQTGGLNAVITAPIATAFPIVGSLVNRFKLDTAQIGAISAEFGISVEASRFIKDAFDSGATLVEMMEKVARSGDERMIADANMAFTKLLDGAATVSPSLGAEVQKAVGDRVLNSSTKLGSDLDAGLGTQPQGTQTILDNVAESTKTARADAYDKAKAFPVNYKTPQGAEILRTLKLLDKSTIDKVNKLFAMQGKKVRIKYTGVDKNGKLMFDELPNTEALDLLKRQLDKVVEGGTDPLTKNLLDIDIMVAEAARDSIRDNLKAINPAYAYALSQGQGKILTQKAILLGQKMLNDKTTADEVKIFMRNASKEEVKGVRQGLREQIENIMSNAKTASTTGRPEDVSEAMKLITTMSSRSVRLKVEQILGKKTSDAMFKRLDESRSAIELQAGTRTGSGTASRQEIMTLADKRLELGPIGTSFEGQPVKALQKLRDFFTGTGDDYFQARKEAMFREITDLLTKTGRGGKDVDTALEYLEKVRRGENLTKPQASYLTLVIKNGLTSTSAPIASGVSGQRYLFDDK
jgi:hypothetical protein